MQESTFKNEPITQITINPEEYLRTNLNKKEIRLLDILIGLFKRFKQVYASQTFLGDMIGVTRETINRMLKKLCSLGLINRLNRNNKRTCLYYIPTYFSNPFVRSRLCHILPALFALTLAPRIQASAANVTQYEFVIRNIYTINKNRSTRTRTLKDTMAELEKGIYDETQPISPVIRRIQGANIVAQVMLSAFPDEAIRAASAAYARASQQSQKHFRWFVSICKHYCEINNIKINRDKVYILAQRLNVNLKDEPIITKEIEEKQKGFNRPVVGIRSKIRERKEILENKEFVRPPIGPYSIFRPKERVEETFEQAKANMSKFKENGTALNFEFWTGKKFEDHINEYHNQNVRLR